MIGDVSNKCFEECTDVSNKYFTKEESVCIQNCTQRYFDGYHEIVKKAKQAKAMMEMRK